MDVYFTRFNYSKPFMVTIEDNIARIYKNTEQDNYEDEPSYIYEFNKLFIGRSLLNEMTTRSGFHGEEYDGNTFLLKMDGYYIYIGDKIVKFTTNTDIMEFKSPIGLNEVPYPYAIDEDSNYYLFLENVVLSKTDDMDLFEPYKHYYMNYSLTGINYDGMTGLYIEGDNEKFNMTFTPNMESDFDRITENNTLKLFIEKDDMMIEIDKSKYVELLTGFGQEYGYKKIDILD